MRILLVDDSRAYQEAFAQLLIDSKIGYSKLDIATNAADGIKAMFTGGHDIYFVDYRLPGDDGLALVREARSGGVSRPIILLTAFGTPFIDHAAEQAGASDYLPKGEFTAETLSRTIRYCMRNAVAVENARAAESRFRLAQDVAGIGTWDWNLRTNTKVWSRQMRVLYGLDPDGTEPIQYETWLMAVHPDDRNQAQSVLIDAVAGKALYDVTFRVLRPDRDRPGAPPDIRWIAAKGEVSRDASGAPYRMIGVNADVTDHHVALERMRESRNLAVAEHRISENLFRTYFENAPESLFQVLRRSDGQFIYEAMNPAGLQRIGKSLAAVFGHTPAEVLGADAAMMMQALRQVYTTGQPSRAERVYDLPVGRTVFDSIFIPLRDEAGEIYGIFGSGRDITEQRATERSLRQAQKMEALGQLAGGVAHDFNNLLTGMLGCFELLEKRVATSAEKRLAAQGMRAVHRATALTSRLLAFSRQQPLTTEPVDLNASLDEMTEMLRRTLGGEVRIALSSGADLWPASTDRNQVELAILNLAINARDAMPKGGTMTIETRNEHLAQPRDGIAPGDYVVVAVSDTGTGMPPEVLARVTEPFFTTKPSGKGTGLGLSMVSGVVRQLGGGLRIISAVNKGTTVSLYLPRAAGITMGLAAGSTQNVRILLVESDPSIQAIVTESAAEAAHVVTLAHSTHDAQMRIEGGEEFDILIVDYSMPGLPYHDLAKVARARIPDLPVLVISGQANSASVTDFQLLAKPFRQEAFNKAIADLLAEGGKATANVVPLHARAKRRGRTGG